MNLSGWGKYPTKACRLVAPRSVSEIVSFIKESDLVARGNGRSYGDSSFNTTLTLSMEYFNCLLNFDDGKGIVEAEAGVLLKDIIDVFLPKGWFPPVSPGTKFVTLGGMIAADVHGKNHHLTGSFGSHVLWLDIITAQGRIIRCGPNENCELFQATIGGMGLTGIILRAAFKLQRVETGWIRQQTLVASNLKHVMELFNHSADWEYTVAWVDCSASGMRAGRSLLFRGNHLSLSNLNSGIKVLPSLIIAIIFALIWLFNTFHLTGSPPLYLIAGVMAIGVMALGFALNSMGPMAIGAALALGVMAASIALIFYGMGYLVEKVKELLVAVPDLAAKLPILVTSFVSMSMGVLNLGIAFGITAIAIAGAVGILAVAFFFLGKMALGASIGIAMGLFALLAMAAVLAVAGSSFGEMSQLGESVMKLGEGIAAFGSGLASMAGAVATLFAATGGKKSLFVKSTGTETTMLIGKGGGLMIMPPTIKVKVDMPDVNMAPTVNVRVEIDGEELRAIIHEEIVATR